MQQLAVALLAFGLAISPGAAQVRPKAQILKQQGKQQKQKQQQRQADALERFLDMSPEDRETALANLEPERRQQILRRLEAFDMLSPLEKRVLRGRLQFFLNLPPRRQALLRQEIQLLRQLNRAQRRRRLTSPVILDNLTAEEIRLLQDVAELPDQQDQ